jgi:hypothetical protein
MIAPKKMLVPFIVMSITFSAVSCGTARCVKNSKVFVCLDKVRDVR